jgi:5'-deoxynucleotidase YfbR-like HD superfamily hydrolase
MARTQMETASGLYFDFAAPTADVITLGDIAHALSLICRFGGHIPEPWSVAQHALLVRQLVIDAGHPEHALAALHHDSHEAYLGDIPTPLKTACAGAVERMAEEIDAAIGEALRLDPADFHHPTVRWADEMALRIEAAAFKRSRGIDGAWPWRELPEAVGYDLSPRDPDEVRDRFLAAHILHWELA